MGRDESPIVFDRAADYYDATRGYPPGVAERVAALVAAAAALGTGSRVLELGVGTGRIALPLAEHAGAVFGVDLSRPMLEQLLAKRGPRPVFVVRGDVAALPFPDGSVDAVVGVHVFHLIPRWRDVLLEVARVLRPDGLLVHAADEQSDHWASWRRHFDDTTGYQHVGVPRERFERFPEDLGWRPVEPVHRIRFTRRLAPQELIDRIARRTWSATWRMSDADLERAVSGLRAELVDRFGVLERPVELETGFWARAYRPPAA